jgi:hypothetical protein
MWWSSMRSIPKVFCLGRGWTPRDELYGIADQSIDPGLRLHKPIGIPELSTLGLMTIEFLKDMTSLRFVSWGIMDRIW